MASPPSEALLPWALAKLGAGPAAAPELRPVAGDASHRRYFRFHSGGRNYVLAEAPPALEKNPEFVTVQGLLDSAGVRVPALFAVDLERGFLLQEDLGDQMLLPLLEADSVDEYYARAFDLLRRMAVLDTASCPLPAYDATLLGEELDRFEAWFLRELLGRSVKAAEREMLRAVSGLLIASALEQPRVLVHRDFHSRNLMLDPGGELAVIDFQDAVVGPVTYDLVSLLRDCYIRWPREQVRDWALAYRQQLVSAGLPAGADE
jgi:aminoglycoside/choline kinase family phosphotransferase